MPKIKKLKKLFIPNAITSLNILCGTISTYLAFTFPTKLYYAGIMILLASVFDFFDGFVARLLNAQSEFGKQYDSLSDVISFGLAPTFIMLKLLQSSTQYNILPFIAFIIIIFSAIRLAIFNITNQKYEFSGLPTPALAIFVAALPISIHFQKNLIHINIYNVYQNEFFLFLSTIILSILLITKIKMFSLKFKTFKFADNKLKFIFIFISIILLIMLMWSAIPLIILLYITISINLKIFQEKNKKNLFF